jgi:DNA-binding CsgD family transcriptional regulator
VTAIATFEIADPRLATPPIRGRADELKVIGEHVNALAHGRSGVLVIEGRAGIGKSRLLTEVLTLAEKAGVRTVFGEAFEHQREVPFFSLYMATLRAHPPVGDVDILSRLGGTADLSFWVVHHLQDAIRAAAEHTPLAIVLEDIHWADDGTLLALRSLTTAHPDVPVLWVLTTRTGAGGPAVADTLAVLRRNNATFVRTTAMSTDAVTDMIQDVLRAKADESLLTLAARADGNPYIAMEMVGGLEEEGRLDFIDGRVVATGTDLPHRMTSCMRRRLDLLSTDASELVRVAAVLPEHFSAGLLAAMLERQPASLMSALAEAVGAGYLVDDGEQLRFGHELAREATRKSLPQSLKRAMERQSASIMLDMGIGAAEVATQLARSAEPGDKEAISALRQAAQAVRHTDVSVAADFSKRALELMTADDFEHGRVVAETVVLLNRARRYEESEQLAVAALARASADEEAEIRLRLPAFTRHSSRCRVEENRRALELGDINHITRARHTSLLAYNLMLDDKDGQHRASADEAAAAAEAVGDVESGVIANLTLACFDGADGHTDRALGDLKEWSSLARTSDLPIAHLLSGMHYVNMLSSVGRLDEATEHVTFRKESAHQERNVMAVDVWATIEGSIHLAAGRLGAVRTVVDALPPPEQKGAPELDMIRMAVLADVALRTDDRNLLQQTVAYAQDAYPTGSAVVRRTAAHVLAMAAWFRNDRDEATRWFDGDVGLFGPLLTPHTLDQVILSARIAATGDADNRTSVLRAIDKMQREEPTVPLFTAVAQYARGILEADAEGLIAAANRLASTSRPLLYAGAAEDAAAQLILDGRTVEAVDHLNAAFDTYTRLEAVGDARRVARELRHLGIERRIVNRTRAKAGWDSLTDSELKVVNIIARGASNRAVAKELQLSLHTVKNHVHNAFTKLDITSRAQLAQTMR